MLVAIIRREWFIEVWILKIKLRKKRIKRVRKKRVKSHKKEENKENKKEDNVERRQKVTKRIRKNN